MDHEIPFEEWVNRKQEYVRADPLSKSQYYRQAMYLYDLAWNDCGLLLKDLRGREVARQLVRSVGSICANIEEAYGRGIDSADAVRILRIALGEARETRGWYLRSERLLPNELQNRRINVIDGLIAMLVTVISKLRQFKSR